MGVTPISEREREREDYLRNKSPVSTVVAGRVGSTCLCKECPTKPT